MDFLKIFKIVTILTYVAEKLANIFKKEDKHETTPDDFRELEKDL